MQVLLSLFIHATSSRAKSVFTQRQCAAVALVVSTVVSDLEGPGSTACLSVWSSHVLPPSKDMHVRLIDHYELSVV